MSSRFINVVARVRISFLLRFNNITVSMLCVDIIFCFYSPISGHLSSSTFYLIILVSFEDHSLDLLFLLRSQTCDFFSDCYSFGNY